jgi:nucleoside-diphosphate-sugar epimerase
MKVLVTGAAGYIGSVLTRLLLNKNYEVVGFDNLLFGGDSLISLLPNKNFTFIKGDIRNQEDIEPILGDIDAIIHLAAIVGDPACSAQPELSKQINFIATKTLFDLASNSPNINRFIFASTCSNYGKMDNLEFVNEDSPLKPVSLYAELKVKFEEYLLKSNPINGMASTSLRFSTVYGSSPRMRFDLTVNDFMREVASGNELLIFGKQFWRPYCHVNDLARSCVMTLESDDHIIKNQVFGVGETKENYQKLMIAEEIKKIVPNANIKYVDKDEDPRDYRVDFSKIKKSLDFNITKKVPDGLKEIYSIINSGMLLNPYSKIYSNI